MQWHIKCFEEKLSQAGKKQSVGIKSFYSNTCYGFEYKKTASVNFLLKWKKKNLRTQREKQQQQQQQQNRAEKAYAYRMLLVLRRR